MNLIESLFLICNVLSKYLNISSLSKYLLDTFISVSQFSSHSDYKYHNEVSRQETDCIPNNDTLYLDRARIKRIPLEQNSIMIFERN
jgi:hypothetical protein